MVFVSLLSSYILWYVYTCHICGRTLIYHLQGGLGINILHTKGVLQGTKIFGGSFFMLFVINLSIYS
jgi:hypothetical protein